LLKRRSISLKLMRLLAVVDTGSESLTDMRITVWHMTNGNAQRAEKLMRQTIRHSNTVRTVERKCMTVHLNDLISREEAIRLIMDKAMKENERKYEHLNDRAYYRYLHGECCYRKAA